LVTAGTGRRGARIRRRHAVPCARPRRDRRDLVAGARRGVHGHNPPRAAVFGCLGSGERHHAGPTHRRARNRTASVWGWGGRRHCVEEREDPDAPSVNGARDVHRSWHRLGGGARPGAHPRHRRRFGGAGRRCCPTLGVVHCRQQRRLGRTSTRRRDPVRARTGGDRASEGALGGRRCVTARSRRPADRGRRLGRVDLPARRDRRRRRRAPRWARSPAGRLWLRCGPDPGSGGCVASRNAARPSGVSMS